MPYVYIEDGELKCNCGCGLDVRHETKQRLDNARRIAGVPFRFTSGGRCLSYNRSIGSKDSSSHPKGCAADIKFSNSREKFLIVYGLMQAGFTRIGINDNLQFIHADDDEDKPQEVLFKY